MYRGCWSSMATFEIWLCKYHQSIGRPLGTALCFLINISSPVQYAPSSEEAPQNGMMLLSRTCACLTGGLLLEHPAPSHHEMCKFCANTSEAHATVLQNLEAQAASQVHAGPIYDISNSIVPTHRDSRQGQH